MAANATPPALRIDTHPAGALDPTVLAALEALDAEIFSGVSGSGSTGSNDLRAALAESGRRGRVLLAYYHRSADNGAAGDDAPVGYAIAAPQALVVRLARIGVAPHARRRGVGAALVQVALAGDPGASHYVRRTTYT
jgi:GNAT superfamily N-acetyltransferase